MTSHMKPTPLSGEMDLYLSPSPSLSLSPLSHSLSLCVCLCLSTHFQSARAHFRRDSVMSHIIRGLETQETFSFWGGEMESHPLDYDDLLITDINVPPKPRSSAFVARDDDDDAAEERRQRKKKKNAEKKKQNDKKKRGGKNNNRNNPKFKYRV